MDDYGDEMTRLRFWANEVWDDITRCTRVRAMWELSVSCAPRKHLCKCRHWCTCCTLWAACNCACSRHSTLWCCSWSQAWSHCSCCCCGFRRSHIAQNFLYLEIYSLHFFLGISWYCVCCLSIATWQSGDDIHDLGGCHLRCWRSLFSEHCVRPWVVFYNITSEYNSTFIFLVLCLQFNIFRWHNVR